MDNLKRNILAEIENIQKTLFILKTAYEKSNKSVIEFTAIGAFLNNIYNGMENILKQILKSKDIKITKTELWHKELLKTSVSENIISEDLADKLYKYLAFRHFFVHGYGFMLDENKLSSLANSIDFLWQQFLKEINIIYRTY